MALAAIGAWWALGSGTPALSAQEIVARACDVTTHQDYDKVRIWTTDDFVKTSEYRYTGEDVYILTTVTHPVDNSMLAKYETIQKDGVRYQRGVEDSDNPEPWRILGTAWDVGRVMCFSPADAVGGASETGERHFSYDLLIPDEPDVTITVEIWVDAQGFPVRGQETEYRMLQSGDVAAVSGGGRVQVSVTTETYSGYGQSNAVSAPIATPTPTPGRPASTPSPYEPSSTTCGESEGQRVIVAPEVQTASASNASITASVNSTIIEGGCANVTLRVGRGSDTSVQYGVLLSVTDHLAFNAGCTERRMAWHQLFGYDFYLWQTSLYACSAGEGTLTSLVGRMDTGETESKETDTVTVVTPTPTPTPAPVVSSVTLTASPGTSVPLRNWVTLTPNVTMTPADAEYETHIQAQSDIWREVTANRPYKVLLTSSWTITYRAGARPKGSREEYVYSEPVSITWE